MVKEITVGKKYWYVVAPHLFIICLEVTSYDNPCWVCQLRDYGCPGYHIIAKDIYGTSYHDVIEGNFFEYTYEGHMEAFNQAMRDAQSMKDYHLAEAAKMDDKMRHISKERNAVIQK